MKTEDKILNETSAPTEIRQEQNPSLKKISPQDSDISKLLTEETTAPYLADEAERDAVGFTMFDMPSSEDNTVTVLLPKDKIDDLPSQSLVRIKGRAEAKGGDGRIYLGVVTEGPFCEPDGLRADAPVVIAPALSGAIFMPKFHGRVQVQILSEEVDGGQQPPRFRPRPNSPVFRLSDEETRTALKLLGEIRIGLAIGYENLDVRLPIDRKDGYFRHTGELGTTGSGKSTTVSNHIRTLSENNVAVILLDTEGEYTHVMHPTTDPNMIKALKKRGLPTKPVPADKVDIYHPVGRDTLNRAHPTRFEFSLKFSELSRYLVPEILGLNEAQDERFQRAFDMCRKLMWNKIYPVTPDEQTEVLDLDELEEGFPKMTVEHLYDVVRFLAEKAQDMANTTPRTAAFTLPECNAALGKDKLTSFASWRKVQGYLGRLVRLGIFDHHSCPSPDYARMTQPGRVSIVDLSDTDSPMVRNLVISQILRGVQKQQDLNYKNVTPGFAPRKVVIIIEEAHEFLHRDRIKQMDALFQQVAKIARRGRKKWLGLLFSTQFPQHLPDEVLALLNTFFLHKISDANVISRLSRSIGGIDDGLWGRLSGLSAGQAIVSAPSMTRPLLVSLDPTPSKLLMVE